MTVGRYTNAVQECCPQMMQRRKCLYIGANAKDGMAFVAELRSLGYDIDFLEIWKPYCDELEKVIVGEDRVINEDAREFNPTDGIYDLAVWWHGPEHLRMADTYDVIERLRFIADGILIGLPWGKQIQGEKDGNPHQKHCQVYDDPKWFSTQGLSARTVGTQGKLGGQIIAWRKPE